jgi:hypothetical protein
LQYFPIIAGPAKFAGLVLFWRVDFQDEIEIRIRAWSGGR